ncbi:MAG: D-tyrosyl-tRNA(Tyr) deacylase [Clostridia bacterium]|nr:D-tyrosyl-tRNA(Tyr) deacylase [Clostridia bacterium]
MKAVIQVVKNANLTVDDRLVSSINKGYVIYFGVGVGDTEAQADFIAKKISALRIFEDENGKTNLSIKDVGGEILFVSQFTLYANASHGNRPDFLSAEKPERANNLYLYTAKKLEEYGLTVKLGEFGEHMVINQVNDGPFTLILEK